MKNKKLKRALHLLNSAWLINKKAKIAEQYDYGYAPVADGQESAAKLYREKVVILKKVIAEIKKYQLPIKYWKAWGGIGMDIIYFEYNKKQVSFHNLTFKYGNRIDVKERYGNGWQWSKRKNNKMPFRFIYNNL